MYSCCKNSCGLKCLDGTDKKCCGEKICSKTTSSLTTATRTSAIDTSNDSLGPTATQAQNPLVVLQTAVPTSAQLEPDAACFLQSQYAPYYSTPSWYTSLPTAAQSYYSSVNMAAASTMSSFCTKGNHTGGEGGRPPPRVIAGAVIGPIGALAAIGALGYLATKAGILKNPFGPRPASQPPPPAPVNNGGAAPVNNAAPLHQSNTWSGISGNGWSGVSGDGAQPPPQMTQQNPIPPILVGGHHRRSSDEQARLYPTTRNISDGSLMNNIPRRPVGPRMTSEELGSEASGLPVPELGYDQPEQVGWTQLDSNQLYEAPEQHGNHRAW